MFKAIIDPILNHLDSEVMHTLARESLHYAEVLPGGTNLLDLFSQRERGVSDPRLKTTLAGIELDNPVFVGAGWDKEGRAVRALYHLGFSGVEIGSVLEYAQPGNPKPRQFVIGDGVALNSLGFNSHGMQAAVANLLRYRNENIPIGVNIGKNKDVPNSDAPRAYAVVAKHLYNAASYFAVNVSSPNTPGLRELQDKTVLTEIVKAVKESLVSCGGLKPLFVKIAPELTFEAVDEVIRVATDNQLSGIIATNTTNNPEIKAKYGAKWKDLPGGVSGKDNDYRRMATERIAHIYKSTNGALEIIGVGGVADAPSALEKILAGASVIQVVTALRGEGPCVARNINRGILLWMQAHGIKSLSEVRGNAASA